MNERRTAYRQIISATASSRHNTKPVTVGKIAVLMNQFFTYLDVDNDILEALIIGALTQEQRITENDKELKALRSSLIGTISILRNTVEKVQKIPNVQQVINRLNNMDNKLRQLETDTRPTITAIRDIINKKVEEQKSKKSEKLDFDFFQ